MLYTTKSAAFRVYKFNTVSVFQDSMCKTISRLSMTTGSSLSFMCGHLLNNYCVNTWPFSVVEQLVMKTSSFCWHTPAFSSFCDTGSILISQQPPRLRRNYWQWSATHTNTQTGTYFWLQHYLYLFSYEVKGFAGIVKRNDCLFIFFHLNVFWYIILISQKTYPGGGYLLCTLMGIEVVDQ